MVYSTVPPSRLLTPPKEEEEVYPYRRVWRSIIVTMGILFGVTVVLFVVVSLLGIPIPSPLHRPLNYILAVLPVGLWAVLAWLPERAVLRPRIRLLPVMVISALVANAVGYRIIEDVFFNNQWLSLASAIDRIIGYTFTVGVIQESLKYLILRLLLWPENLRTRTDAIAYAEAAALGYALVNGLQFVSEGSPTPDMVASRVFSLVVIHLTATIIISYGIAESRFSDAQFLLLPMTFALGAFVTGLAVPLRSGFVNADIAVSAFVIPRQIFGIGFTAALLVAVLVPIAFLYDNAERKEREMRGNGTDIELP